MAHPLLPAFSTMTKNRSPNIFRTALIIKKYKGDALSPKALKVLEKKLYKKVNISPRKIIRKYCRVISIIDASTCSRCRIGTANTTQSKVRKNEKTTPDNMVVLICLCKVS